jgi:hypothetical protein
MASSVKGGPPIRRDISSAWARTTRPICRVEDPNLAVDASSVLVLCGCGPVGGPGMSEWG